MSLLRTVIWSSYREHTGSGAHVFIPSPALRIGPLCSRYATFNVGYTNGLARHIFSVQTRFTPWTGGRAFPEQRVLDCHVQNIHKAALARLFVQANFYVRAEELRTYRPMIHDNPVIMAYAPLSAGAAQSSVFLVTKMGLVKATTGFCLSVVSGTLVVLAAGAAVGGAVWYLAGVGANSIFLLDVGGPIDPIPLVHKQHLKEAYGWEIGKATKGTLHGPDNVRGARR